MHASVKVLDIDIDMMTNDVFVQKMNEYLSDDKLDVILFASTELLDKAMGEESYREVIEQADLILPVRRHCLVHIMLKCWKLVEW